MNCIECGSEKIGYDAGHGVKYCRACGVVADEGILL